MNVLPLVAAIIFSFTPGIHIGFLCFMRSDARLRHSGSDLKSEAAFLKPTILLRSEHSLEQYARPVLACLARW